MENEKFIGDLPENFRTNLTEIFCEDGRKWLSELPQIVAEISKKHCLKSTGAHFSDLSFNYVLPCVFMDDRQAVIKIGFPKNKPSITDEFNVLKVFDGIAICRALDLDTDFNAMFLERLLPGEDLREVCATDDHGSNVIAVDIMRKLWRKPPETGKFILLEEWLKGFTETMEFDFEAEIFFKGCDAYRELLAQTKHVKLLHGDLHHENILSSERDAFLAIDPKGIIGDIGYEISVFLNNPRTWILEHDTPQKILKERIVQFSDAFEIEPAILHKWALALPILAAFWSHQDNSTDWTNWLALARIWESCD